MRADGRRVAAPPTLSPERERRYSAPMSRSTLSLVRGLRPSVPSTRFARSLRSLVALSFIVVACGGSPTPPAAEPKPDPAPKEEPKPAGDTKKEPEEKKEPVAEPPPAPEKAKSTTTIAGVSISDIDAKALVAAVQKIGWAPQDVQTSGGTVGKYENIRFGIASATLEGTLEIIRPAKTPTGSSASMMKPKDQAAMKEGLGAVFVDKDAEVAIIIVIEGKPAEAKKVLDKLLKGK